METVSVSKGVFVFKNGYAKSTKKYRKKPLRQDCAFLREELWYQSFKVLWVELEQKIQVMNNEIFSNVLESLISFIKSSYSKKVSELPAATLLTGINMPDHAAQFSTLSKEIQKNITPHVAMLHSQDSNNLKALVENMISQLINDDDTSEDEDPGEDNHKKKAAHIKKSQCSFALLQSWYEEFCYEAHDRKVLAIIIPDFESFNAHVLQSFIQIASNYINILPFVLIFGVATSLTALNKAMPYHVSSKINIQVFNSQPSTQYLNQILENVFISDNCPFHLGGHLFALFLDIFLFYDFSVTGFIQNFKYAMLEHFSGGNQFAVCTRKEDISEVLDKFTHSDFENVRRHCLSFRKFVENETPINQMKLLDDNQYFREVLEVKLEELHAYMNRLHVLLKCLQILVEDLPKEPLGKQIRELYIIAVNNKLQRMPEFKEAFQLLGFQSKDEMIEKLKRIIKILISEIQNHTDNKKLFEDIANNLLSFTEEVSNVTNENESTHIEEMETEDIGINDRKALKQQLKERSKTHPVERNKNKYEIVRGKIVAYLENMFKQHLKQPVDFVFHELYFYDDISIQNNVIGSHRAAIHTALNDPTTYLQCNCCKLPNDASILDSMPDICIAYKLHLEYGKMINLYDWLQAFLAVLDPIGVDDDEDKREVDPHLQARFTQCVAELEYLGFVKSSKRKTDHVSRLTWGG